MSFEGIRSEITLQRATTRERDALLSRVAKISSHRSETRQAQTHKPHK